MTTRHYRKWTPEEDAELIASAGTRRLTTTAASLGRTTYAAQRRGAHILGMNLLQEGRRSAGMSMADVTRALGVSCARVSYWVKRGWLPTHTGYGIRKGVTSIDAYDLSAFLAERGALLPYLHPTDLAWKEEVGAARAALLARYIDSVSMRALLHWSRGGYGYVKRRLGFGEVATLSIGAWYPTWYERGSLKGWLLEHPQYMTKEAREGL